MCLRPPGHTRMPAGSDPGGPGLGAPRRDALPFHPPQASAFFLPFLFPFPPPALPLHPPQASACSFPFSRPQLYHFIPRRQAPVFFPFPAPSSISSSPAGRHPFFCPVPFSRPQPPRAAPPSPPPSALPRGRLLPAHSPSKCLRGCQRQDCTRWQQQSLHRSHVTCSPCTPHAPPPGGGPPPAPSTHTHTHKHTSRLQHLGQPGGRLLGRGTPPAQARPATAQPAEQVRWAPALATLLPASPAHVRHAWAHPLPGARALTVLPMQWRAATAVHIPWAVPQDAVVGGRPAGAGGSGLPGLRLEGAGLCCRAGGGEVSTRAASHWAASQRA